MRAELAAGKLSFTLCGEKLKGSYALVRTGKTKQWLLIKHKDRFARVNDLLARHHSVISGVALEDVAANKVSPALSSSTTRSRRRRRITAAPDQADAGRARGAAAVEPAVAL